MARSTKPSTVPPWLIATGVGAAMVGVWAIGQKWGTSIAKSEASRSPNPPRMDEGRQRNPAQVWDDARPFVVPQVAPIERGPLPHACDPLAPDTWGEGRVCVAAGDVFVSVSPSSQHHVKKPACTEVHFSENLQRYAVGDGWHRGVLGRWLSEPRRIEPGHNTLLALQGAGWPMSLGTTFVRAPEGPDFIRHFAETHYVKTPIGSIRLLDLPATPATSEFREHIAAHIAQVLS